MIPRILHQTWKDDDVPERWRPLRRTWHELHPDWEHRFWTDADLRRLVEVHYPAFLPTYDAYDYDICRVDAARYLLMHHMGGVYVDLDFEALRPIEPLLEGRSAVVGEEPASHLEIPHALRRPVQLDRLVCNAFLASTRGHPFWRHGLERLEACARENDPLEATGPFFLTETVAAWHEEPPVHVAPAAALYPVDKHEAAVGRLAQAGVREELGRSAFAVHHWDGSWIESFQDKRRQIRAARG